VSRSRPQPEQATLGLGVNKYFFELANPTASRPNKSAESGGFLAPFFPLETPWSAPVLRFYSPHLTLIGPSLPPLGPFSLPQALLLMLPSLRTGERFALAECRFRGTVFFLIEYACPWSFFYVSAEGEPPKSLREYLPKFSPCGCLTHRPGSRSLSR